MQSSTTDDLPTVGSQLGEIVLIVLLLFVIGSGLPPAVNEVHYLGKAKHLWSPDWCAQDAFLQSADAHLVFSWVYGWVTTLTTLPAAAWIGRAIGWILLAIAFQRLSSSIVPQRGYSILSAAIWMTLVHRFHMSGEWLVDGVEAKVFAYPLLLFGLVDLVCGKWYRVWLWFGAASSFHVLVGGWAVIMLFVSWVLQPVDSRPRMVSMIPGICLGGLLAVPGLIPALQLSSGVSPEVRNQAQQIYVFERLAHHLQIRSFDPIYITRHLLLMVVFFVISVNLRQDIRFRRLWGFTCGAILLVVGGALVDGVLGESGLAAALLRFYWFRPSDVFVPLGCAIAMILGLSRLKQKYPAQAAWLMIGAILFVSASVIHQAWSFHATPIPAADRQGGVRNLRQLEQWRDICQWCDANLSEDSLVLTPLDHQTFRWYSNRSELVNWKDVPQDARGLVQWQKRRDQSAQLHEALELNDRDAALRSLEDIALEYPVEYFITRFPVDLRQGGHVPLYYNRSYAIYQLARGEEESESATDRRE